MSIIVSNIILSGPGGGGFGVDGIVDNTIWYVHSSGDAGGEKGNPGKPFDVATAIAGAVSGETICFLAGDYTISTDIHVPGVKYRSLGGDVNITTTTDTILFDKLGQTDTGNLDVQGDFNFTLALGTAGRLIDDLNQVLVAGSTWILKCKSIITTSGGSFQMIGLPQAAAKGYIEIDNITCAHDAGVIRGDAAANFEIHLHHVSSSGATTSKTLYQVDAGSSNKGYFFSNTVLVETSFAVIFGSAGFNGYTVEGNYISPALVGGGTIRASYLNADFTGGSYTVPSQVTVPFLRINQRTLGANTSTWNFAGVCQVHGFINASNLQFNNTVSLYADVLDVVPSGAGKVIWYGGGRTSTITDVNVDLRSNNINVSTGPLINVGSGKKLILGKGSYYSGTNATRLINITGGTLVLDGGTINNANAGGDVITFTSGTSELFVQNTSFIMSNSFTGSAIEVSVGATVNARYYADIYSNTKFTIDGTLNKIIDYGQYIFDGGVAPISTLTLTANPIDGETVTIGSTSPAWQKIYTFKNTLVSANDVKIGATASDTLDNLIKAINLTGVAGTDYGTGTTIHVSVSAAAGAGDTMVATGKKGGLYLDTLIPQPTTETLTNGSWDNATLVGGVEGAIPDNVYL